MTRYAPPVELTVKNISEDEMSISLKVEGLKPDPATAEMVARALEYVFSFGHCGDAEFEGSHSGDYGVSVKGTITHLKGRRLLVSLPATEKAFDGETGKALAEALAFLWEAPRVYPQFARRVIEARAALHDRKAPRESDSAVRAAMRDFGLPVEEARAVTRVPRGCYGYIKNSIRTGEFKP